MTAATERWTTGILQRWSDTFDNFIRRRTQEAPNRIEIASTGLADSLNTKKHNLGRIPTGVMVVNQVVPAPGGAATWYRLTTDSAWTATEITLRFDVANARVLLEIS